MVYDIASVFKIGGRKVNQDYVACSYADGKLVLAVCDGLGAYENSELASRICAERLISELKACQNVDALSLANIFKDAHDDIVRARESGDLIGASTTAVCFYSNGKVACSAHSGDSRIYLLKNGKIAHVSKDHSLAQVAVDKGEITREQLRDHGDQNKLTRVVGGKFYVLPDVRFYPVLNEGQAVLLCSDGWWKYVYENEMIEDVFSSVSSEEALCKMERRLLERADEEYDNYSAVLAVVR